MNRNTALDVATAAGARYLDMRYTSALLQKHVCDCAHYINDVQQFGSNVASGAGCIDMRDTRVCELTECVRALLEFCHRYEQRWWLKRFVFAPSYKLELERLARRANQRYLAWMVSLIMALQMRLCERLAEIGV